MAMKPLDEKETALVQQVIHACQQAIKTAVHQPSRAIGLAKGLDAALTSLRLVQTEIGKGEAGARAVIEHADAITRRLGSKSRASMLRRIKGQYGRGC